jgi:hypothetical protein
MSARSLVIKSYLGSLPKHINGDEKVAALTYLVQGAARCGDNATTTMSQTYEPCDVAAIIGNAFDSNPSKTRLPHYKVRKMVMDTQRQLGKYWLSIDSNVFIYKNRANPHKYLRYSFNGVFPATGIYCNDHPGDENWVNIRRDYNMDLAPWRQTGEHVLICLQRPMGWSMRGQNLMEWLDNTFLQIRKHTDRPVKLRWHPGDWKNFPVGVDLSKFNAVMSPQERHITEDLKNCWAVVCHNSTPSSVAVIEGVPAFITDDPGYCQAGEVSNTDLSKIENPVMPDRSHWIKKLAQCHWSFQDLQSGRCWAHMRQWVK